MGSEPVAGNESQPLSQRELSSGFSGWPNAIGSDAPLSNHRRSITSTSGYNAPIWESFQPLTTSVERDRQVDRQVDRQRVTRRFSLAPASGFHNYDAFLDDVDAGNSTASGFHRNSTDELVHQAQAHRRHSVAGLGGPYIRPKATPFNLASSLESLQLNDNDQSNSWGLHENLYEEDEYQAPGSNAKELGKGLSLGQLSHCGSLYVVEFKAGRTDLFYVAENSGVSLKVGDLVIVEADRGKDLGKITNDSITPQQIQAMQAQQAEIAALQAQQDGGTNSGGNASGGNAGGGHRAPKEIHPKRIFRLAQPSEVAQLVSKNQDELKAMMICQTKVRQKRLPMEVVDAEYQWDRRKLTFYFIAERRIDFRELVRDLFKIYKTRIWMYAVSPSTVQSNAARLQSSPPQPPQPLHQPGPSGTAILTSPTSPRSHSEYQSAALSGFHLQYSPQHGQYAHYSHYHHVSVPLQHHQQTQQLMPAHLSSSHSFHPLSPLSPLSPPIQQQQQQQQQHHHLHQQLQQQQQNSYPYSSINS
ncbi:hypothetical protein BGX31_006919 [Mortierella sp. GBA43]|nr:hypothetical protein BGX31_006919 [Mortierella sp. GBA43]